MLLFSVASYYPITRDTFERLSEPRFPFYFPASSLLRDLRGVIEVKSPWNKARYSPSRGGFGDDVISPYGGQAFAVARKHLDTCCGTCDALAGRTPLRSYPGTHATLLLVISYTSRSFSNILDVLPGRRLPLVLDLKKDVCRHVFVGNRERRSNCGFVKSGDGDLNRALEARREMRMMKRGDVVRTVGTCDENLSYPEEPVLFAANHGGRKERE